jgi:NADH-quinone oxidoreductase subunit C
MSSEKNAEYWNKILHEIIDKYVSIGHTGLSENQYYIDLSVLHQLMQQLKCTLPDLMLTYICGVDYPAKDNRFEVIYQLLSLTLNMRLTFKVILLEGEIMDSIVDIFPNSGWYEREIWDMYGVLFQGNPDMRRILTDYGFVGHPMKKDFPLTGYIEVSYNRLKGNVEYTNIELQQDFRNFSNISNWNILHGDEKANRD